MLMSLKSSGLDTRLTCLTIVKLTVKKLNEANLQQFY